MLAYIETHEPAVNDNFTLFGTDAMRGQSFTSPTDAELRSAYFYMQKLGAPTGPMTARLYHSTGVFGTSSNRISFGEGVIATSDPVDASSLSTSSAQWVQFDFSGVERYGMSRDGAYFVVVHYSNGTVGNIPYVWYSNAGGHDGVGVTTNGVSQSVFPAYDFAFKIYADTAPYAQFASDVSSGAAPLTVNFTDTSLYTPTSWSWSFGDSGTSTSQNPTHNYSTPGLYSATLQATNAYGYAFSNGMVIDAYRVLTPTSIASTSAAVGTPTLTVSDPPPPPPTDWSALGKEDEKVYVYKVYEADGTYVGTWTDVIDELEFSQRLNTPGTTTTVRLGRSANTKKEVRDTRITEAGDTRITEAGDTRTVVGLTSNTVGEDTDVELNYRVDVYVHYGEFADRITESGDVRITEDGDTRIVTVGAPLGTRIFSGYVMDYESVYGSESGVTVTLASHGMELSQEVIRSGTTTTVPYSATALETIAKSILDTNPGTITYSTQSIDATGVNETLTFRLNTKLEGIESVYDQTPDGWYWYGNVAENLLYLKPVSADYDHVFIIGEHIKELRVKRSIEDLKNAVWFIGGESGGSPVYKYYEDAVSQTAWRKGIERITDRRYTVTASMQRRADKLLGRYAEPIYTSPLTISSARYDIESIRLGQTVGFRNFDNFIDELPPLQIVSLSYTPTAVTIELGELQERQIDQVAEAQESLADEQYQTIPNAPS